MLRYFVISIMLFATVTANVAAEEGCGESIAHPLDCNRCHTLTTQEAGRLLSGLGEVKSVKHSPVKGLYEVSIENGGKQGIAYVDYAKKYVLSGPIFSAATRKPINAEQPVKVNMASLPVKNSVVLGNPDGKKKLFVFTDPDCPFCSKLHHELVRLIYMEPDLTIYIKLFPLKMHPQAYDKSRVILGAADPVYMLNRAFSGEQLPEPGEKDSKEPVDETIKLAESLGITGTPTLVLPDGRIVNGFKEADKIKRLLAGEN